MVVQLYWSHEVLYVTEECPISLIKNPHIIFRSSADKSNGFNIKPRYAWECAVIYAGRLVESSKDRPLLEGGWCVMELDDARLKYNIGSTSPI